MRDHNTHPSWTRRPAAVRPGSFPRWSGKRRRASVARLVSLDDDQLLGEIGQLGEYQPGPVTHLDGLLFELAATQERCAGIDLEASKKRTLARLRAQGAIDAQEAEWLARPLDPVEREAALAWLRRDPSDRGVPVEQVGAGVGMPPGGIDPHLPTPLVVAIAAGVALLAVTVAGWTGRAGDRLSAISRPALIAPGPVMVPPSPMLGERLGVGW